MSGKRAAFIAAFLLLALLFVVPVKRTGAYTAYTNIWSAWVQNSLIDNTIIGQTTPAAAWFTTSSASAGYTGNLTGNASTATALAATPAQCASGSTSTGITANGTANCSPGVFGSSRSVANFATCNSGLSSTDGACTGSVSWSPAFADTSYVVTAQMQSGGAFLYMTVTSKSTTGFSYTLTCSFNCGSVGTPTVDVWAYHP